MSGGGGAEEAEQDALWGAIEASRAAAGEDAERFRVELSLRLARGDVRAHARAHRALLARMRALRVDGATLHQLASACWGGCSDDSYLDLQDAALASGRASFERLMSAPRDALTRAHAQLGGRFEGAVSYTLGALEAAGDAPAPGEAEAWLARLEQAGPDAVAEAERALTRVGPRWPEEAASWVLRRAVEARVEAGTGGWPERPWRTPRQGHGAAAAGDRALVEALLVGDVARAEAAAARLAEQPPEAAASVGRALVAALAARDRATARRAAGALRALDVWSVGPLLEEVAGPETPRRVDRALFQALGPHEVAELWALRGLSASHFSLDTRAARLAVRVGGRATRLALIASAARAPRGWHNALEALRALGDPLGALLTLVEAAQGETPGARPRLRASEALGEAAAAVGGASRPFEALLEGLDAAQREAARGGAARWLCAVAVADPKTARAAFRRALERCASPPLRRLYARALGVLGDAAGRALVEAACAAPSASEAGRVWTLRAVVGLRGAGAFAFDAWGAPSGAIEAAWLSVARCMADGDMATLRQRLPALEALAAEGHAQYEEGLLTQDERQQAVGPAAAARAALAGAA